MISALTGRTLDDADQKLSILAVGDDDQNIYTFRGANVEFIRRFQQDYEAEVHYLVENYRSSQCIIDAANSLIAANHDRMKTGHPIRIDTRRKMLPRGGRFGGQDHVTQGKVQMIRVPEGDTQAHAVLAEIRRLRQIGVSDWCSLAVLSRSNNDLAQVRALAEKNSIPIRWCPGQHGMPPLHQVREIHGYLRQLAQTRPPLAHASELRRGFAPLLEAEPANPWLQFLSRLLDAWQSESDNAELPVQEALEFLYESCAESRRDFTYGEGVVCSTVHSAKGMEYDHVLLIGDWPLKAARAKQEEERRAFYVGMTRARESLTVFHRTDVGPCLPETLTDSEILKLDFAGKPRLGLSEKVSYTTLGLDDIYLGYPGRFPEGHPVHAALSRLKSGDHLTLRAAGAEGLGLFDGEGVCVGRLSRKAVAAWQNRLESVRDIRVLAIVHRTATQEAEPDYRERLCVEEWELPVTEVREKG